ncbi:DMT family transporter [Alcaligenes nematophilus]|jgi:drug/metabolite transporter (DMT)-like permease|uniref:DMT family transporter n=1 Tax=Alcaligenes nematophilus TaxID=2994643 RepID=A0ABU3MR00_9BURK|nr:MULTISPECIES: DMT family transporter [Alcaligenes]MDH4868076.1 DMT family transporter [Bacillus cereus]MCB4323507.1 DMT family transporter [Alcaligenes sp. 13f]MCX5470784.1 DMT family transporter [Alcaligenes nematophilus]MDT8464633.1 DMT family transporter [Alcaligenes nematophilus]MDT8467441.1 DMT family transporter [Alcaligenes nematophilus]
MTHGRALAAIHVAAVLFGLTGIFGELIQVGAMLITAGRASFAVLALFISIRSQGRGLGQGMKAADFRTLLMASIMLAIHWATFFVAVKVGGVAIATLGFASFPAFITLCEWAVLRERVTVSEWIILALVTVGLLLVTPSFDFQDQSTIGLAWAIASGFTFAMFTLINRRAAKHLSAQQVAWWENLFVALMCWPFAIPLLGDSTLVDWVWIALLGVFCTALSHYLLVSALTVLNARSAGIVIALEPVYAIAFAALLFAQYPSSRALLGGAIMIGAITWAGLRPPKSN